MAIPDHHLEYRQHLVKIVDESADRFEKQLSYISAGGLGVSMAFITDVVGKLEDCFYKGWIITGWILLGATLLINLLSQLYTSDCHSNTISEIDEDSYSEKKANCRRNNIKILNYTSAVTLILGIISIIIFITLNI